MNEIIKEKQALKEELSKQESIALKLKCRELIDMIKRYDVTEYSHLMDVNEELSHLCVLCQMKGKFIVNYKESYILRKKENSK